jgi:membrane protein
MGLLFVASILLDTTTAMLHDYIEKIVPSVHMLIVHAVNILFSILVVTSWFTILFKVLPDARTQWRVALCGGILTAVLFNLGKFVLGKLLLYNTVVNIFGASASFALILLFIFYSSLILYYGASFTYVVGDTINMPIIPGKYSNRFELKVLSDDEKN